MCGYVSIEASPCESPFLHVVLGQALISRETTGNERNYRLV